MSVLELENQVLSLPPEELDRFSQWFDDYRRRAAPLPTDREDDLTPDQQAELRRRMAVAREHPELREPWEGTIDQLRQELDAYRAQKASGRAS